MPNRFRHRWPLIILLSSLVAPGCTPEVHRYIRFPDLFHPGTAAHQRAAAVEHDPFPENDIAPPIVGGRPLGYQAGVVEAERMTMNAAPPPGVAPTIVPGQPVRPLVGTTFTPAPVYAAPPAMPPVYTSPPPVAAPAYTSPPPMAAPAPAAAPPPIITTPYPPATSSRPVPFTQQQRSPY